MWVTLIQVLAIDNIPANIVNANSRYGVPELFSVTQVFKEDTGDHRSGRRSL